MKINLRVFALMALVVSVVLVSGCAQPAAQNQTVASGSPAASAAPVIKSQAEAQKTTVETSKDVKKISDTLAGIDNALAGK